MRLAEESNQSASDSGQATRSSQQVSHQLSAPSLQAITLKKDVQLRATRLSWILFNFGRILDSESKCDILEENSSVVHEIDAFLSHNWSTKRFLKYIFVAFHFNGPLAALIMVSTWVLCGALVVAGWIPVFRSEKEMEISRWTQYSPMNTFACKISAVPVFVVATLMIRQCHITGFDPQIFLDKACIEQKDKRLKDQAVASLGAYVVKSKSLVVVYTDVYLGRLWTVYELATALLMNPTIDLHLLPLMLPHVVVSIFATGALTMSLQTIVEQVGARSFSVYVAGYLALFTGVFLFGRVWARQQLAFNKLVENFDVRNAACSFEADRSLVNTNIVAFMRDVGLASRTDTEQQTLDAFNMFVREHIPQILRTAIGTVGLTYFHALLASAGYFADGADIISCEIRVGSLQGLAKLGVFFSFQILSLVPNLVAVSFLSAQKWLERGLRGTLAAYLMSLVVIIALSQVNARLRPSRDVPWGPPQYGWMLFAMANGAASYRLYLPRRNAMEEVLRQLRMKQATNSSAVAAVPAATNMQAPSPTPAESAADLRPLETRIAMFEVCL